MPGDHLEIPNHVQEGPVPSERDQCDQGVHHRPHRFVLAAAGTRDKRSVFEVGETFHFENLESCGQVLNRARRLCRGVVREQLHEDRSWRGDWRVRYHGDGTEDPDLARASGRARGGDDEGRDQGSHRILHAHTEMFPGTGAPDRVVTLMLVGARLPGGVQCR